MPLIVAHAHALRQGGCNGLGLYHCVAWRGVRKCNNQFEDMQILFDRVPSPGVRARSIFMQHPTQLQADLLFFCLAQDGLGPCFGRGRCSSLQQLARCQLCLWRGRVQASRSVKGIHLPAVMLLVLWLPKSRDRTLRITSMVLISKATHMPWA